MNWTKREVRETLGFTLDRELAEFFGLGKGAISAWGEDDPIPVGRQWELRARLPERFPAPNDALNPAA